MKFFSKEAGEMCPEDANYSTVRFFLRGEWGSHSYILFCVWIHMHVYVMVSGQSQVSLLKFFHLLCETWSLSSV